MKINPYRKAVCDVASFRKRNSLEDHLLPSETGFILQTKHNILLLQNKHLNETIAYWHVTYPVSEHSGI